MTTAQRAVAAGFGQVAMPSEDLSAAIVAAARARGLQVQAYRIKNEALMRRAIDVGSNGMTIHWPERLIHALEYIARPEEPGGELSQPPTPP